MSLRRKGLYAIPLLLGCWTLKPGDAVPEAGTDATRVEVASLDVVDAPAMDAGRDASAADMFATDAIAVDLRFDRDDIVDPRDVAADSLDASAADAAVDARDVVAPRDGPVSVPIGLRPIGPQGLSTVTTSRPTLRWSADVLGVEVAVCSDRACAQGVRYAAEVSGRAHAVAVDLAPDAYFWHLRHRTGERITPTWQFRVAGNVTGARAATALGTSHRDMDNDGYADVALGAPGPRDTPTPGAAYVFRGGPGGPSMPTAIQNPAGQSFGWDIAWGDFNGDNLADLAVASFDSMRLRTGNVTVLRSMGTAFSPGRSTLTCPDCGSDFFATTIATGDTNGDGLDDLYVANPTAVGRVHVWRGAASGLGPARTTTLTNPVASSTAFGSALSVVGDLDGDGFGDLVVGAPCDPVGVCAGSAGRVHVYFGSAEWGATGPAPTTVNGPPMGYLGAGVSPLGDLNDDGYADFAVSGAAGLSMEAAGVVRVYLGGPRERFGPSRAADVTIPTATAAVRFGASVAGVDLNGDGRADLLVGAPGDERAIVERGRIVGYLRTDAGVTYGAALTTVPGSTTALIGLGVSAVGDTNGDGLGDWVVTAPAVFGTAIVGPDTAYLWFGGGSIATRAPDRELRSMTSGAWLGRSVAP